MITTLHNTYIKSAVDAAKRERRGCWMKRRVCSDGGVSPERSPFQLKINAGAFTVGWLNKY